MTEQLHYAVCHVTSVHRAEDIRIFHKQCAALAAVGYKVTLIAADDQKCYIKDGITIISIKKPANRLARVIITGARLFYIALKQHASIYQFHDPELLPYAIILAVFGNKVIFDFHEDVERKLHERSWLPKPLRQLAAWLFRVASRLGGNTFAAKFVATPAIAKKHSGKRVHVIANYPLAHLNTTVISPDLYLEDNVNLIYTGGWTANRGARQLVEAMQYVSNPEARLTVIGQVEGEEYDTVRNLPSFRRVNDLGRLPYNEAVLQMRKAAIGLVCSQYGHGYDEALPNKLFEYLALGLPVIASDFPLWREMLENRDCVLFVDPSNAVEIAGAIDSLLLDSERRKNMGKNGRRIVRELFSWERESERLVGIYKEILNC